MNPIIVRGARGGWTAATDWFWHSELQLITVVPHWLTDGSFHNATLANYKPINQAKSEARQNLRQYGVIDLFSNTFWANRRGRRRHHNHQQSKHVEHIHCGWQTVDPFSRLPLIPLMVSMSEKIVCAVQSRNENISISNWEDCLGLEGNGTHTRNMVSFVCHVMTMFIQDIRWMFSCNSVRQYNKLREDYLLFLLHPMCRQNRCVERNKYVTDCNAIYQEKSSEQNCLFYYNRICYPIPKWILREIPKEIRRGIPEKFNS